MGPAHRSSARRRRAVTGPSDLRSLRQSYESVLQPGSTVSQRALTLLTTAAANNTIAGGKNICQSIRAEAVDCEISRFVIASMNRENINLALSVQDQIRTEFVAADAQRANRIEALRYEVNLAQRRFFEVDPANRLVAATLEADWNERLLNLEQACREREAHTTTRDAEISDQQVLRIQELTQDFERVWNAPETKNTDRKRLLGLLIEDATLTRDGYEVSIELRMRGGKTMTLGFVSLPKPVALLKKTRSRNPGGARPAA